MKNYVSFNAKYYKNSNAAGEIGHVQRVFAENTNQIKQFAADNFGCGYNIYDRYKEVYDQVESIKGKKIQKNSNTFMDGVLSFSRDQMLEIMKKPDWKTSFSEHIEQFMQDVKEQTGMEPLGWEMHMDEGHKDPETGEYKMNYHAQCIFFNYDFKTNTAPLRKLEGRKGESIWSKLQGTAGQRFEDLGFVRGVSADMTKAKHQEKDDFIASKQAEIERLQAELVDRQTRLDRALQDNQEILERVAVGIDDLIEQHNKANDIFNRFEERIELEKEIKSDIKEVAQSIYKEVKSNEFLTNLYEQFKTIFPETHAKIGNLYNKVAHYFNKDSDASELLPLLKEAKESIPDLENLQDELKRKTKIKI